MTLLIVIFILSLLFLGVALLNAAAWPKVRQASRLWAGQASILIPARNEELNLPGCLDAAIRQGDAVIEILVYNDHSTDQTAQIIERYSALDSRIRPVEHLPLAPGWCGKNFACYRLAAAASGNYLIFIDADARLSEGAAARMVEEMETRRLKFLSCWPGLEMAGFWERVLMPALNFVVFSIFPAPLSLIFQRESLAIAHGACLSFERKSYFEIGGHGAVRDQIFEDVRLAQLSRAHKMRGLCLDGQDLVKVRMYSSFEEIWKGFQKNFFPAFRHEINFWIFVIFHLVVFLSPFILLIFMPTRYVAASVIAILLTRLVLAIYFRHPILSVLLHPLSEAILLAIGLSSWRRCKNGRGVVWKGREYQKT